MAALTALGPDNHPPGWCFHHERVHGPAGWGDLCRSHGDSHDQFTDRYRRFTAAWDSVDRAGRARPGRPGRWLRRWTVCWWKHRTRKVADSTYLSRACWACAPASGER